MFAEFKTQLQIVLDWSCSIFLLCGVQCRHPFYDKYQSSSLFPSLFAEFNPFPKPKKKLLHSQLHGVLQEQSGENCRAGVHVTCRCRGTWSRVYVWMIVVYSWLADFSACRGDVISTRVTDSLSPYRLIFY